MSDTFIAASEIARENERVIVFRFSDELADAMLSRWSAPVQMKLEPLPDGTYNLICRSWDYSPTFTASPS